MKRLLIYTLQGIVLLVSYGCSSAEQTDAPAVQQRTPQSSIQREPEITQQDNLPIQQKQLIIDQPSEPIDDSVSEAQQAEWQRQNLEVIKKIKLEQLKLERAIQNEQSKNRRTIIR